MPGENELDFGAAISDIASGMDFNFDEGGDDAPAPSPAPAAPVVGSGAAAPAPQPAAASPAPAPASSTDGLAPAAAPTPAAGAAPVAGAAPKTWRPEAAAAWESIPQVVKDEIAKREEDVFRGIESYRTEAAFGKSIKGAIAQYIPLLEQHGIDPVQQVQGLMNSHYTLAFGSPQEKIALVRSIISDYGIDPQAFGLEPSFVDPQVASLQSEIKTLKSHVESLGRQSSQELVKKAETEIQAFAADPANIHFSAVINDMQEIFRTHKGISLKDAYDKAVWNNPATRQKEIDRIQTDAAAKRAAEEAERAAAAKAATAANVKSKQKSGNDTIPAGSMEDTIKATLADIKSRG